MQTDRTADCYRWSTGVVDTSAIRIKVSGLYWVSFYKNCTYHIDSFWVSVPPFPEVMALQYGCPDALSLMVQQKTGDTSSYQYHLDLPDGSSRMGQGISGYMFRDLSPGAYGLKVTSAQGCDTTFQILLRHYPVPELKTWPLDTIILYGAAIQIHARGAVIYTWSPAGTLNNPIDPNPIARPKETTHYQVVGKNDYGCPDTGYVMVRLDYSLPDMLPNAFSPNGDGLNDVFRLSGITHQQLRFFKVFNRFGQIVFYTTKINEGWDGTFQKQACDVGTYYYQLELLYPDGRVKQVKGDVHLIR